MPGHNYHGRTGAWNRRNQVGYGDGSERGGGEEGIAFDGGPGRPELFGDPLPAQLQGLAVTHELAGSSPVVPAS